MATDFPVVQDLGGDAPDDAMQPPTTATAPVPKSFIDDFKARATASDTPPKPAAEPAKPAAVEPAKPDDTPPPTIKSTKAAEEWRKLKEIHASEKKILQQQLEAEKASKAALEAQAREYSDKLKILALADHPEFKQKYTAQEQRAFEQLGQLAGDKGKELTQLLKLPANETRDARISELVDALPTLQRAKVGGLLARIDEISAAREAELSEAATKLKEMTDAQRQQYEIQQTQARTRSAAIFDAQAQNARALEVFELRDGDDAHNSEVQKLIENARAIFDGKNSEADVAKAALWAVSGPKYREALHTQIALNQKLTAEIARLQGANPELSGGKSSVAKGGASEDEGGFVAKMSKLMRG